METIYQTLGDIYLPKAYKTIEEVSQIKYLGVFFDEKLSWKKQIQYIFKTI